MFVMPIVFFGFCLWASLYTVGVLWYLFKITKDIKAGKTTRIGVSVNKKFEVGFILAAQLILAISFLALTLTSIYMQFGVNK